MLYTGLMALLLAPATTEVSAHSKSPSYQVVTPSRRKVTSAAQGRPTLWRLVRSLLLGRCFYKCDLDPSPRRCTGPESWRLKAVPISARCENACGKLPICRRGARLVLFCKQPHVVAQA